ncbi:MAG: MBL fold metallo-hydrolase [Proteobacteria bacterium]|nr:MBL fold metallo-hydrolase [Pseudomonadota bacterium]
MRVTILGSGPSSGVPMIGDIWGDCDPREPRNHRRRSSILIESGDATVLVDSSPDCRAQLLDAGVTRLDAILYTHAHADHSHGIDDLRWINAAMKAPLPAYGDAHTLETLQERFGYCFTPLERFEGRPLHYYKPVLEPNEVTGPFEVAGMAVTPFEQQHGRRSKTLGFRIGNFAYSTDVSMLDEAAFETLSGVDTWIVDAFRRAPHPTHAHLDLTLSWIARIAPRHAMLVHMGGDLDYRTLCDELPAGVEPGYDGMVISL